MTVKTLLIPGLDGSPSPHWQAWWSGVDPSSRLVQLPDQSSLHPEAWETEIAGALLMHPGAVLVAHSLGAIAAVRLLSRWPQVSVGGLLLVAPAEPDRDRRLALFGPIPERLVHVPTIVVASRNDPWMTFTRASGLAHSWGAGLVDLGFAGHINVESGLGPWPRGMELRDELPATYRPVGRRGSPLYQCAHWSF